MFVPIQTTITVNSLQGKRHTPNENAMSKVRSILTVTRTAKIYTTDSRWQLHTESTCGRLSFWSWLRWHYVLIYPATYINGAGDEVAIIIIRQT